MSPTYIIEVIKSVIGYFNLDPNRVLDIILESFECQPSQHKFFVSLLGEYLPDTRTMCELLSFKYSFYLSSNNEDKEVYFYLTLDGYVILDRSSLLEVCS